MLQLFETLLLSGGGNNTRLSWTRQPFMYTIAIHHLSHYLFDLSNTDIALLEPRWSRLHKIMKSNSVYCFSQSTQIIFLLCT
jgi:hypothetical protein